MAGTVMILYFGSKNILLEAAGRAGCRSIYDLPSRAIRSFPTSPRRRRKLFNAVHKAQVSWKRIHPYMERAAQAEEEDEIAEQTEKFSAKQAKVIRNTASFLQII